MKKNCFRKLMMCVAAFLLVIAIAVPAYAESASVDVRFVVKNQQGPYKGVSVQFGPNTKTTGSNGTVEFRLKKIPVTTMVMAHLADPKVPSGHHTDVHLALGAHEDVQVNSTGPASADISIMFTEHTSTIVIEYFVDQNYNYGYSNATFEHKLLSAPSTPKPQPAPQQPADPNPQPQPEGFDPDMPPEGFHEEMPPEEFFEEMPPEEFQEHFEEMPPEEFREEQFPEYENYGEPFIWWQLPGYVWLLIIAGLACAITIIVLLVKLGRKSMA